jgi:hypothetical protein
MTTATSPGASAGPEQPPPGPGHPVEHPATHTVRPGHTTHAVGTTHASGTTHAAGITHTAGTGHPTTHSAAGFAGHSTGRSAHHLTHSHTGTAPASTQSAARAARPDSVVVPRSPAEANHPVVVHRTPTRSDPAAHNASTGSATTGTPTATVVVVPRYRVHVHPQAAPAPAAPAAAAPAAANPALNGQAAPDANPAAGANPAPGTNPAPGANPPPGAPAAPASVPGSQPAPAGVATQPAPAPAPAASCGFGVVTCTPPEAVATARTDAFAPAATGHTMADDGVASGTKTSLDQLAQATATGAREVLHDTYASWLNAPSFSAGSDAGFGLQVLMLSLAAGALAMVAIWQAIRLMITRRGAVLADLLRGLFIAGVVTAAGVAIIDSALLAGDQISNTVLIRQFGTADTLVTRMSDTLLGHAVTDRAAVLVMFFSLLVLVLGIGQAIFLVLRQVAIPVLGALLPLAAVGQAGPRYTQTWLTRTLSVVLAICVYKPLVVIILSLGFAGRAPTNPTAMDATRGLVSLLVAVLAFPAAVKLFAPAARAVVENGMDLPTRGSRRAASGAGTPGEVSAVSHATWMAGAGGAAPAVLMHHSPTPGRPSTPPPAVPGQASGSVVAAGGAMHVPPVVVVHEAMGRGDRLIGQIARADGAS